MLNKKNLKTKTTEWLKYALRFHNSESLWMLLDELCDRGENPQNC